MANLRLFLVDIQELRLRLLRFRPKRAKTIVEKQNSALVAMFLNI